MAGFFESGAIGAPGNLSLGFTYLRCVSGPLELETLQLASPTVIVSQSFVLSCTTRSLFEGLRNILVDEAWAGNDYVRRSL